MAEKIIVQVDLGKKAVERCHIVTSVNGKVAADLPDRHYGELPHLVDGLRTQYPGADIEVWCLGEDCAGRTWRWKVDF